MMGDTEDRYRQLIEHTTDLISIVDEEGVVQYHSPSVERVLGYDAREIEGEYAFEYFHPEDRHRVLDTFEESVNAPGEKTERVEYRFQHENGSWVWLESVATNRTDTELGGYVITSRSIEDRKAYEQALEQRNEQLETINRVVRHDIRNDMSIILGWADVLEDHVSPDGKPPLNKIQNSGRHIVELTKIVRDFVKSIGESESPEVTPTDLRAMVSTELEVARETYPRAEFTAGDLPAIDVQANELLGSVFRNIFHNAVQHNTSETPVVRVDCSLNEETVVVRVADNGPGIPDDQKETIFGKGEKGVDSAGAGIGLHLVRTLVDQFGGQGWVEDNEPSGAVFAIELQTVE